MEIAGPPMVLALKNGNGGEWIGRMNSLYIKLNKGLSLHFMTGAEKTSFRLASDYGEFSSRV